MRTVLWLVLGACCAAVAPPSRVARADDQVLATARLRLLRGAYAEAAELYRGQLDVAPGAAGLGLARALAESGDSPGAQQALTAAHEAAGDDAQPAAELARLALERGAYDKAREWVDAALARDEECVAAQFTSAELARLAGRYDEAQAQYNWLVEYYNANEVTSAESLVWIGRGAAVYARWKRLHDQFRFLVNDLYPDAIRAEQDFWPAHYEAGLLFLEKFNRAEAQREFQAALAINQSAAAVHAALAQLALQSYDLDTAQQSIDRALEINPQLLAAHLAQVDVHLANFEVARARAALEKAQELNGQAEETLGRLAAVRVIEEGFGDPIQGTGPGDVVALMDKVNPHAGTFFLTAAQRLEVRRKFTAAEWFFREAMRRMPRLIGPRGELGLMLMRLGREAEAEELLTAAFQADPFHVRVSNMLKVLEVLSQYETLETEHFLIRYDGSANEVLARAAGEYLEEVYPQLCERFAYWPKEKSLFEIFSKARNTAGHGWFSARMVGLPYIGTVGACAGKMVALASPTEMKQPFNWARVLRHEFVHVLNLQQTNFNLPHWFAEAIAVHDEGYPRPIDWTALLRRRWNAGTAFDLTSINFGFIRPQSSDDWTLAYCQSELYAEYMLDRFGDDAIARLLAAIAENLETPAAIERAFAVALDDFEAGYRAHVESVLDAARDGQPEPKAMTAAQLVRAVEADPKNPDLLARAAIDRLARKSYPAARRLAQRALAIDAGHQLAGYVIARLHLLVGSTGAALRVLEECLDRQEPEPRVLSLLAGLRMKAGKYDESAELYRLGRARQPSDPKWLKALARVHLEADDDAALGPVLTELATLDADNAIYRKKLAEMARERGDHAEAADWARRAIHVNVMDVDLHRIRGEALAAAGDHAAAARALTAAVTLNPQDDQLRRALADAYEKAGSPERAREVLEGTTPPDKKSNSLPQTNPEPAP